ncbi:MAG: LysR family transcriptional regulator [Bacillota bacterium]|nr:LysR family transcriptional regulator [Bacillota bacterium]
MNLKQLQYFRLLAKTEHFTKSASKLFITQPSLSQAISELEKELGVKLFERKGRNVKLTTFGQAFLPYVEKGLTEIEKGEKNLQRLISTTSGVIDLAFIYSLGTNFVPSMIQQFVNENSDADIGFSCYQGTTQMVIKGLKEENYDIAFCTYIENESDIELFPLAKQEIVLIANKNHPLTEREFVELKDIAGYKLVCFNKNSGLRPILDKLFAEAGIIPEISCEVAEDNALIGLVEANQGIGILPRVTTLNYFDIKILPTKVPIYQQAIYMAISKNRYLPSIVQRFRDFIIENNNQQI